MAAAPKGTATDAPSTKEQRPQCLGASSARPVAAGPLEKRHSCSVAEGPQAHYMHATSGVTMPLSDEGPPKRQPHSSLAAVGARAPHSFKHAALQSAAQRIAELRGMHGTEGCLPLGSAMHTDAVGMQQPIWCASNPHHRMHCTLSLTRYSAPLTERPS